MQTISKMHLAIGGPCTLHPMWTGIYHLSNGPRDSPLSRLVAKRTMASLTASARRDVWATAPNQYRSSRLWCFVKDPDAVYFQPDYTIPLHFVHWLFPDNSSYTVSPPGHPNTLRLKPSSLNLTAYPGNDPAAPLTFIACRQNRYVLYIQR
jgi:hypothetical protein